MCAQHSNRTSVSHSNSSNDHESELQPKLLHGDYKLQQRQALGGQSSCFSQPQPALHSVGCIAVLVVAADGAIPHAHSSCQAAAVQT